MATPVATSGQGHGVNCLNLYTPGMVTSAATGWSWFHPRSRGEVPVVCLHGFGGGVASWTEVAAHPSAPHPMLALALPGHCGGPAVAASFDDNVRLLLACLDRQRICLAHLVGYSLGGRLALGLARLAPERIAHLTLIGAHPGLRDDDADGRAARRTADANWAGRLRAHGCGAFFAAWEDQPLFASQAALGTAARAAQASIRAALEPACLADALEHLSLAEMPDSEPVLAALGDRTTLVTGALDDKFTTLAHALATRHALEHVIIEGVGHNVVLEAPAQLAYLLEAKHPRDREPCP